MVYKKVHDVMMQGSVNQLKHDLMKLRGMHSGVWEEGIEKDERTAVKLVYAEYQRQTKKLEILMNAEVQMDYNEFEGFERDRR